MSSKFVCGSHQLYENFVRHFFRSGRAAGHVKRVTAQGWTTTFVEFAERVAITFLHQAIKFFVAALHHCSLYQEGAQTCIDRTNQKVPRLGRDTPIL